MILINVNVLIALKPWYTDLSVPKAFLFIISYISILYLAEEIR